MLCFVGLQVSELSSVYWTPEFYILELFTVHGLTSFNNSLCDLGGVLPNPEQSSVRGSW